MSKRSTVEEVNWEDTTTYPYMAYDFEKIRYSNSSSFNIEK